MRDEYGDFHGNVLRKVLSFPDWVWKSFVCRFRYRANLLLFAELYKILGFPQIFINSENLWITGISGNFSRQTGNDFGIIHKGIFGVFHNLCGKEQSCQHMQWGKIGEKCENAFFVAMYYHSFPVSWRSGEWIPWNNVPFFRIAVGSEDRKAGFLKRDILWFSTGCWKVVWKP